VAAVVVAVVVVAVEVVVAVVVAVVVVAVVVAVVVVAVVVAVVVVVVVAAAAASSSRLILVHVYTTVRCLILPLFPCICSSAVQHTIYHVSVCIVLLPIFDMPI